MNTGAKYGFTGETLFLSHQTVREIIALRDFGLVKKGQIGGWLADEDCLSHRGGCWVGEGCAVWDKGRVSGNAQLVGNVFVTDKGWVSGNAFISGSEIYISGLSFLKGNTLLAGTDILIDGSAQLTGNSVSNISASHIGGHYLIQDRALLFGRKQKALGTGMLRRSEIVTVINSDLPSTLVASGDRQDIVYRIIDNGTVHEQFPLNAFEMNRLMRPYAGANERTPDPKKSVVS